MILHVSLPNPLPARGATVKLRFKRVPPRSCVVKPTLDGQPLDVAYLYGRGEGSAAKEQAFVNVRIDARAVAAHGARPSTLTLAIETLDGQPIDEPGFLELVDHQLQPM